MTAARQRAVEISVGLAVSLGFALFVTFAYSRAQTADAGGYVLTARFSQVDGLEVGAQVLLAGIPIGRVESMSLDQFNQAVLELELDPTVELDNEASASIVTDGLFGDKAVQIDVGGGDRQLGDGDEITYTESTVVLDDLLQIILDQARTNRGSAAPAP